MNYKECEETSCPTEIRSLIGVAASITEEDIAMDEKLAYLLNK